MIPCQLIIDPPQRGSWNMAVDEWLLARAAEQGVMTLRFYQWNEPTLSLGYFQSHQDRELHQASRELPMIRRASGGGALVHHHELTYSLAVPADNALARDSQSLYDHAHLALVDALSVNLLGQSVPDTQLYFQLYPQKLAGTTKEPLLCFLRRAKGDVVFSESSHSFATISDLGHKICGSAQRKARGAILQHGGVLVRQSPYAPELQGLVELVANLDATAKRDAIEPVAVSEWWIETLTKRLGLNLLESKPFSTDDLTAIDKIEQAKFAATSWTCRR